jgi:hypothetical protein
MSFPRFAHISATILGAMTFVLAANALNAAAATKTKPELTVTCPTTTQSGTSVSCTAHLTDGSTAATGTLSFAAAASKGTLSSHSCTISGHDNTCSTTYLPTGTGSQSRKDTITVTYAGDTHYTSARATTTIGVTAKPNTNFSSYCPGNGFNPPEFTTPAIAISCTVTVHGINQLSGAVTVSAAASKGAVTSGTSCPVGGYQTFCQFAYVPQGEGSSYRKDTITVHYPGDLHNNEATLLIKISVGPRLTPLVYVQCPNGFSTTVGTPLSCSVNAYSYGSGPPLTGTVTVSVASSKGAVTPTTCAVNVSCPISYTPQGRGSAYRKDTITATYSGDIRYLDEKATAKIAVTAP